MWTASGLGLLAVLAVVDADVFVYTRSTPHSIEVEYLDVPADFGLEIPMEGLRGFLVEAEPRDGCSNMTRPPTVEDNFTGMWIALIAKHNCSFETQVRNAQAAGFNATIVHNINNSSDLEVMTADDPDGISIVAVFVTANTGLALADKYVYTEGFYIMVNDDIPFNIRTRLLLSFAEAAVLGLLVVIIVAIMKCIKDRRRRMRHRLPNRALDKIPTYKFSKGDPYETCAICLDDYQEGDKLRVLPCAHAYHSACIDPWLTQNKRVCPVCKRRVFAAGERRVPRSTDSSDAEDEPLLANPPPAAGGGGTFDEQRENPFARATRFMARLRARANGDPEIPPSPPNDNEHINAAIANNDENGNTSETAPLVPNVVVSTRREGRARRPRASRTRGARAARPSHWRAVSAPADHSANTQGEIGVAAIPAPGPRRSNL